MVGRASPLNDEALATEDNVGAFAAELSARNSCYQTKHVSKICRSNTVLLSLSLELEAEALPNHTI
jgi:hypothetical protein